MAAEWDPAKARSNFRKHGVRFADAVSALEDPGAMTIRDESEDEQRWITLGMDSFGTCARGGLHVAESQCPADLGAAGHPGRAPAI